MTDILWFNDIHKGDISKVGGKGANLGEMYNAKLPVPPGFAVTTEAYKKFLEAANIKDEIYHILENLDVDDNEALQSAAKKVQSVILTAEMPDSLKAEMAEAYENLDIDAETFRKASREALDIIKIGRENPYVAVRSSATAEDLESASFAGQQATYLNIKGISNLIKAIQQCWASLFTARAIYYRIKNNFDHSKVFISVIIQKMVYSNKSGVIFSVNPVSNNNNEILIEAGFGLGEAVVSGAISPDQYIVDKETLQVIDKKIHDQTWMYSLDAHLGKTVKKDVPAEKVSSASLSDFEVKKLAEFAIKIEDHYGSPQDIEFAIEGHNVYIVQSRPITTLKKPSYKSKVEVKEEPEQEETNKEVILTGQGASPGVGAGAVKIVHGIEELDKVQEGNILVTHMTDPDMVPAMKRAAAIVTDAGGSTCHAAIVSREMGVPCIVGTEKATEVLKEDDIITVDATNEKVYRGRVHIKEEKQDEVEQVAEKIETVTEIKVLIDMPEFAEKAAATGADGVGLLRAEFLILQRKEHPMYLIENGRKDEYVTEIYEGIKKITEAFNGKPVWYRTLDAPTDEFRHMIGGENEPEEDNPMIGWRSIRRSLDQPELLRAEFEAIKRVHDAGLTNVGIMLPLVTDVEQIKKSKEILREFGLEPQENIDFGVMIETPASVQIIRDICEEGIDFVSFGTNDLTQFTLAVDRNSAKVAKLYDEMHPAVLKQIQQVVKVCKEYGIETSICGQAGSNEKMAEFLVKVGIDSISANIDAVHKIRAIVHKVEKKLLLSAARKDIKL